MIVDCDSCEVRGAACGECVIGVLLGVPEVPGAGGAGAVSGAVDVPSGAPQVQLAAAERRALDVLADQGLIPRLRVVPTRSAPVTDNGGAETERRNAG
ncbi:hypothetical protein [Pseudonocardia sp. WMMC193]|uniref:hypothetical protein n=1 Tax=Pseudonocardia sp. WMMC193 TaxID=2911965 RepID=UPI001F36AF7C|nr:hypothetical protein [Pseudonocardia sp. WMMC193]MCF7548318.1 hypothetical protein [Pseudonocardia sp. WMMC193]